MPERHRFQALSSLLLLIMLLGGCSTVPPGSADRYGGRDSAGYTNPGARSDIVRVAAAQIGTPYRYGGNSRQGFDCSGLVEYAHRHVGIRVPRTTAEQWRSARAVRGSELMPGDLVFFSLQGFKSRHVGIYEGNGVFIHAPSSGKLVSRASLENPYWRERLVGAGTFL